MSNPTTKEFNVIREIHDFLSEFEFEGIESGRFYNTFLRTLEFEGRENAKNYLSSYFKLINNAYKDELIYKMQSQEFENILDHCKGIYPLKEINSRLEIYFGNPGVGKTVKVISENPKADVMICNSDFEPNDLLEVFDISSAKEELKKNGIILESNDDISLYRNSKESEIIYALLLLNGGKPKYTETALLKAIKEGKTVILDEIGKLTRKCQDFLVGFTDNKEFFEFKGERITIKDGFKIIGTMNLEINNNVYDLQSPLVDRASKLIEMHPDISLLTTITFQK